MSPLKITLLLNLHVCAYPLQDYPRRQKTSRAMISAFADFRQQGLLHPEITHDLVLVCEQDQRYLPGSVLTEKGQALVQRLQAVEP